MKYLFLLLPFLSFAQFSETVNVEQKKSDLYSNTLAWFAHSFKSSNDVIQMKDQETGVVIGKGILATVPKTMGVPAAGSTYVTITIKMKDGAYKYEFSNSYFQYTQGTVWKWNEEPDMSRRPWEKWKSGATSEIEGMVVDMKKSLIKSNEW